MFYGISSSSAKMAGSAGRSAGMPHIFSHFFQINICSGHPGFCRVFSVGSCCIMADKTVDF
jgi:hypothetical protein